jgi:eukaryotic-like serine/threonine-protein kinase
VTGRRQTVGSGRYRLERLLGHGAAADVHLARDVELDRPVAVKLLTPGGGHALAERFAREARRAAAVAHPNVVRVFDVGEEEGLRWIVMEYVEGESLAELLERRGRLSAAEAVRLGAQAAEGLGAAHRAGLVHRDVTPHTLLVAPDGTTKVADLGVARGPEGARPTEPGTLLGAAAYAAPEAAGPGEHTAAADVYSLAVILYEALTGRLPHEAGSSAAVEVEQREGPITPPRDLEPSVPPALEAVLMRALARDPAYRPADGDELARELVATTLAPTAPTAPTAAARTPASTSNTLLLDRRRPAAIAAAAALAAAVAAGLVLTLTRGGETQKRRPAAVKVRPVPTASRPEGQARNLARWIREYSR